MKCFTFNCQTTADVFEFMYYQHRDLCKRLLDMAQTEAAASHDGPDEGDDMLRDDDMRVYERLAEKLKDEIDVIAGLHLGVRPSNFEGCEGSNPFMDILLDGMARIDYRRIAQALYFGVEPGDPAAPEIPQIEG